MVRQTSPAITHLGLPFTTILFVSKFALQADLAGHELTPFYDIYTINNVCNVLYLASR